MKKKARSVRSKRINVYFTYEELAAFHKIADEQNTTLSGLCRECALTNDLSHAVFINDDDLINLTEKIISIRSLSNQFISNLVKSPLYNSYVERFDAAVLEVEKDYMKLRGSVLEKRRRIKAEIIKQIEKNTEPKKDFPNFRQKRECSISVSVTEEEFYRIKIIADSAGCSMSAYLKRSVFLRYGGGRIPVRTDPLDSLLEELKFQIRFYRAVVADVETRYVEDEDIDTVADILDRCRKILEGKTDSIDSSLHAIRREAKRLIRIHEKERE